MQYITITALHILPSLKEIHIHLKRCRKSFDKTQYPLAVRKQNKAEKTTPPPDLLHFSLPRLLKIQCNL